MPHIRRSDLESERFGINIGRVDGAVGIDHDELCRELRESKFDLVILRTLSSDRELPRYLVDERMRVIPADTLVYYRLALTAPHTVPTRFTTTARLALQEDVERVVEIARQAFDGYTGHYGASPQLDPAKALEGYADWAGRLTRGEVPDSRMFVLENDGQVVGFIGGQPAPSDGERSFEIALNAVSPDHQKSGVYSSGLVHLMKELPNRGMDSLIISTQVWNFAVQSAWNRLGFRLYKSLNTYHVSQF